MRVNAAALAQPMHRGHPPAAGALQLSCPPLPGLCPETDGLERLARPHTSGTTPSIILSPGSTAIPRTEVRPGARATRTHHHRAAARRNP